MKLFLAAALLLAPLPAAADEAQDRIAIGDLMWSYARALDGFDEDAYAALYAEDGAFGPVKGREALRKMVADIEKGREDRRAKGEKVPPMHHVMTNERITFLDGDHARIEYYWMTVFAGGPGGDPPSVAAAGRGVDELVRVGGKWLILTRNVAPKD